MQKILQYILPFELPRSFPDESTYHLYKKWDEPARQIQISAVTFLTAILYITFGLLNKSWAPEPVQALMLKMHVLAVAPFLLMISFLAYKKRFYNVVMPLLALSPIFAGLCHVYIANKLPNYAPFIAEGYLSVLWIFVVSGMSFKYALASASVVSSILLVSGFFIISNTDIYIMHAFWVFCSFSFGFLGALIFDRSRKAIFMNQQELHRLAITDELTGAFNRNHLNSVLSQEIARCRRYGQTFGLLMIDIDHFKNINDTFGHTVGDRVLQKVAQILSTFIRSNDTLVRWGGEEFVVIALEVDENTLSQSCEKLRHKIQGDRYGSVGTVTVSIGATLLRKNDTQVTLISRADTALYEAKGKGRNIAVFEK